MIHAFQLVPRLAAKMLIEEEAWRIAMNVAKLPELLKKP